MPDIIRLLPDSIANQIAAGEVVQRPSSVLKELLENAVDAGASEIQVIIKDAGKTLVQVIDNGEGMSETDARMSFERHATSKINSSDDLFRIKTLGFRGEALASIAAVSQAQMRTRLKEKELGFQIDIEASEVKEQQHVASKPGTSVSVKNLFFNVPARRNFLKTNPVEMKHLIDEFQHVVLSRPDIEFSLYQNDLEVYNLPVSKLSQRIVNIFGRNYREQLAACQEETDHVNIHGYIGKPEFAKKTRGEQFLFVNNRYIKSNYLNHAVNNAFEGLLPKDSYPFYVLFLEIDPKHIDINVHPTKTEIKFVDERTIYGIVMATVKQTLGTHNITPSIDFEHDVNFQGLSTGSSTQIPAIENSKYAQFRNSPLQKSNLENWENLYEDFSENPLPKSDTDNSAQRVTFQSGANFMPSDNLLEKKYLQPEGDMVALQLHQKYLVAPLKSGILLVEQSRAHERVLYEQFKHDLREKSGTSQQLLFPQQINLNPADYSLVMQLEEEVRALGFVFEVFGKNTIIVNGAPSGIDSSHKNFFEDFIEQFKHNKAQLSLKNGENVACALAKRSAIKCGQKLEKKEINAIIDRLFACKNPNYTPSGAKTFVIISLDQMAEFFK